MENTKVVMQYNECKICGANNGRAGNLFSSPSRGYEMACENCKDTIATGNITIHTRLNRTPEELQKTFDILK